MLFLPLAREGVQKTKQNKKRMEEMDAALKVPKSECFKGSGLLR